MYKSKEFTVSVAPMMDWTDRHCRWFHRQLSSKVLLYTEMVVADAVIHGDREHLIGFDAVEHPVALQIGGSDPCKLAEASRIGENFGYDEININVGCPSDRVQAGRFGACLMQEPNLVAECYRAMAAAVDTPVTVKCRLGVDDQKVETTLPQFIETIAKAGASHFIIHARKAWLKGLSPKENRDVPPLDYDLVREMKQRFPDFEFILNGGLTDLDSAMEEAETLDGIMLGRVAYHDPWLLNEMDSKIYGDPPSTMTREDVIVDVIVYCQHWEAQGRPAKAMIRHIMGLFARQPGARLWRRSLSEGLSSGMLPSDIIQQAVDHIHRARKAA